MKSKLTPTTNDLLQNGGTLPNLALMPPVIPMKIVPAHEPLRGEQFVAPQVEPVRFPNIPLPQKAKRGRKPKEQPVEIVPAAEPQPLKIALVGTAPSSRLLAPYNDPTWQIWACSPGNMGAVIPRFDAWFEVHGTNLWEPENKGFAAQYIEWMKNLKVPLYMQDKQVCPNALQIPVPKLIEAFGPYFFTSSFAWMMAMGILAGAKEIALFGIDMASREEYIIQRPGAYHFFMEGAKRGCRITAPFESDIMQPPGLYGFSDVTPYGRKLRARRDELKERIAACEQTTRQNQETATYLRGALEDNDYQISIFMGVQDNSYGQNYLDALVEKNRTSGTVPMPALTLPSQG